MPKRSLSPAILPPGKRPHVEGSATWKHVQPLSFDNSLYDELILSIFSYLSWVDLCATQATNRNWARLAADNELWKDLYLREYGRTRLRGAKGFVGRLDGREVKPLPGHGKAKGDLYKDWKWMFRISSNWRNGRSLVEEWVDPECPDTIDGDSGAVSEWSDDETHLLLAGPWTITASSKKAVMHLTRYPNRRCSFPVPYDESRTRNNYHEVIMALALDQSPPPSDHLSLAVFFSTGEFSVFEFNSASLSAVPIRRFNYRPSSRTPRTNNVFRAAYYHPLLVTLSDDFSLSMYDLSSGTVRHTQTLSSFTSYPPASMVLSSPSTMAYKLVIAYSIPVYPEHWSIGATELLIAKSSDNTPSTSSNSTIFSSPSFLEEYKYPLATTMSILSSRTIRAFDTPTGWVDENTLRVMREQWGRKLFNVADAQTDGKWVIIAPGTNSHTYHHMLDSQSSSTFESLTSGYDSPTSLQLYRLVLPSHSNSISASPPKLNFVRTLHGQMSTVSALALADGRCVSLGQNGSIWVWDLEAGTGAEVAPADKSIQRRPIRGTVSFDDRRIVSAYARKVVIRRFDI